MTDSVTLPSVDATLYVCRLNPLRVIFNTQPITAMLGYSASTAPEMTLATVNDLMHPDDMGRLAAHVERLHTLADGEIASFRHRMRAPSGQWAWIEVRDAVLSRNASGAPEQVIGTAREITAQMQAAEALRESGARHQLLVETMLQGVVHHAADGSIIALNPAAARILGRPREALIGSDPENEERNTIREDGTLFPGTEHPSNVALRTGVPTHGVVMGVFNWDLKEYRWISVDAVPLMRPGSDVPWEVYTVFEDITDRRRVEHALRDAHTRKDQFIATLAHELRNPLAPIRSAVAVQQQRSAGDPELQWSQAIIERQVGHMARLLDDLLDASRIASGKLDLRREPVYLSAIITQAIETARPLIEAARHTLSVELSDQDVMLDADPMRLAQVFANLLTNAAKYTEPGGQIALSVAMLESEVMVRVRDNGIGIAKTHLPRVFEMFGQVQAALERSQGGLGIGLSLAQSLVELHGGIIAAHSEGVGRGTEFTVRLPAPRATAVTLPSAAAAPVAVQANRRVLVVDDNEDGCDSLAALLRMMGYAVDVAYDGLEAILKTDEFHPEVVLMDVGLPKLNGYEACVVMRQRPITADVVILAVTGWGAASDLQQAMESGFDGHLVKPIDMQHLGQLLPLSREEARALNEKHRARSGRGTRG